MLQRLSSSQAGHSIQNPRHWHEQEKLIYRSWACLQGLCPSTPTRSSASWPKTHQAPHQCRDIKGSCSCPCVKNKSVITVQESLSNEHINTREIFQSMLFSLLFSYFIWDQDLPNCPGWSLTHHPLASAPDQIGSQVCATMPSSNTCYKYFY